MAPGSLYGGETTGNFCQLVDKEVDESKVGLPDDAMKRGGGGFFSHNFGNGNHSCWDQHVICSVLGELQKRS